MLTVRELRIKANLPIRIVADAVHLPRSSFSYMERGLRKFPEGKEQQVRNYLESVLTNAGSSTQEGCTESLLSPNN